jgi:tetratricopeptide (TPR) repeat protein
MLKYFLPAFLIFAMSCSDAAKNSPEKNPVDPKAIALNDSAMKLGQSGDSVSVVKAIAMLDQATAIDSNFYIAYWNKRAFQMQSARYKDALVTSKELIRIKPGTPDFYSGAGIVCELMGDSIESQKYFQQADKKYKSILDTMQTSTRGYEMLIMGNGMNMVMMGEYAKGNALLHKLYDEDTDENFREGLMPYLDKDKTQIIEMLRKKAKH